MLKDTDAEDYVEPEDDEVGDDGGYYGEHARAAHERTICVAVSLYRYLPR